jgi:hypothetical protein
MRSLSLSLSITISITLSLSPAWARTVDRIADDLAEQAKAAGARGDVGVVVRGGTPKFASEIAALLKTRLEGRGFRSAQGLASSDLAAAARAGIDLVVELEASVTKDGARVDGNVTAIGPQPWRDEPTALVHLHAAAPLDGELRAYLAPDAGDPSRRPGPLRAHGAPIGDVALLALDVGDIDGDGRAEVVGATADEVLVWRWDAGGKWNLIQRLALRGRPAAVRPRADVATVALEGGAIAVRTSRLSEGVRLRWGQAEKGEGFQGFMVQGIGTCGLEAGVDWFKECQPQVALPGRFWAAAGLRGGAAWAAVDPDLTLWVGRAGEPRAQTARGAGAQVAVAALERGEVVATGDGGETGAADAIVVRAIAPGLPVVGRVDRLPGAVVAMGVGDADGDGRQEIVAAVRDRAAGRTELWIVY